MRTIEVLQAPGFIRWATQRVHPRLIWEPDPSPSELARARLAGSVGVAAAGGAALTAKALRIDVAVEVVIPPGLHLELDATDALQLYLLLFGTWEPSQTALLTRAIGPGDTFIDIGAHLGYYSLLAAHRGARVVAVEPNPEVVRLLRRNIGLNQFGDQIDVIEAAVAADAQGRTLYSGPRHNTGLSSTNRKWNLKKPRPVRSIVVQDLVSGDDWASVRAVKVDVEGAEPEVLRGLADIAEVMPPDVVLLVELSPRWWPPGLSVDDVLHPLTRQGFKIFSIENSYSPVRYLSPGITSDPIELEMPLRTTRRYDLVLARDEARGALSASPTPLPGDAC